MSGFCRSGHKSDWIYQNVNYGDCYIKAYQLLVSVLLKYIDLFVFLANTLPLMLALCLPIMLNYAQWHNLLVPSWNFRCPPQKYVNVILGLILQIGSWSFTTDHEYVKARVQLWTSNSFYRL